MSALPKDLEIPKRPITHQDYVGAPPTIATIRPTTWDMGLTPKRHHAIPTGAGLNKNASTVLKQGKNPRF
jgi:hypothetical protein